jgi:hypothetical protein
MNSSADRPAAVPDTMGRADPTLAALARAVRAPHVAHALDAVADLVVARLATTPEADMGWETVPLSLYGELPPEIRSSWVFALRGRRDTGAERHPNSVQRMLSQRGCADMQTWTRGAWRSNPMASDEDAPFHARWLAIPAGVWHRPVVAERTWVVVSFHTAAADELVEERPRDDAQPDDGPTTSARYHGRSGR